ncbi:OmpA family protein [bacterium]|nr:OmpA family protein [bacterium]
MKSMRIILATLLLTALPAASTLGQFTANTYSMGISLNGLKLVGGATDKAVISYTAGVAARYTWSPLFSCELEMEIGSSRPRDPDSYFKKLEGSPYRTFLFPWRISAIYHPAREKGIRPYFKLGSGLTHWNLSNISTEDNWLPVPYSGLTVYGHRRHITIWAAAGAAVPLRHGWSLDTELSCGYLIHQTGDMTGTGDINTGIIRLGLRLNRSIARRGMTRREEILFQLDEAAPGVQGDTAALPSQAVEIADRDGDAVPDSLDLAPDDPEDIDGWEDGDGRPDPDNDGDGIPDILDLAPDRPETVNGYMDEDGIPDVKPEPLFTTPGQRIILEDLVFATGATDLDSSAAVLLDPLAAELKEYPDIVLEIRGFTDNTGAAPANLAISQKRADAVKAYLVGAGIESGRIRAIGYGEADPVASNRTAEGRAQNRRIEFIRIEE